MIVSPCVKRLEILHPALESIHGNSGHGVPSSSDDHCLGVRILYCTGTSVMITITNIIIIIAHDIDTYSV